MAAASSSVSSNYNHSISSNHSHHPAVPTVAPVTIPSPEELYARARALVPTLFARADATAKARRVPQETVDDLKKAGLFRILQPKRWGGYEMSPSVFYEVTTILAEGDMAVGWVYAIVGVHNWHMALFDDQAARDVWGQDQDVLVASTYMPVGKVEAVEGGMRLSGRWKFSSGCDIGDWVLLGSLMPDENGVPEHGTLLLPKSDYQIVDTWHTGGLRGTGSKDIVVDNAFVPLYRTHRHKDGFFATSPGNLINEAPLYKMPFAQVFIRAVNASAIGALSGMIDAAIAYLSKRVNPLGKKASESVVAQMVLTEATAAVFEMKSTLHRSYETMERYAARGELPSVKERLMFRYLAEQTTTRCADLATELYRAIGGHGLFTEFPFARMFDDISASRQHAYNQDTTYALNAGAFLLGAENTDYFI